MFKENFIKACVDRGVSPTSICVSIGLSSSMFSQWTDTTIPRKTTLIKLAEALDVTVDYLLGNEKEKPVTEDELSEEVVIYHRDGKMVKKHFAKEQMEIIAQMLDGIPEKK